MIQKSDVKDMCYLTPMQEGMLFHYLMDKESIAYFEQMNYRISGELDPTLFDQAFVMLIDRYDILRTTFVYEKVKRPLQVVLKKRKAAFNYKDISSMPEEEKENWLQEFKIEDRKRGFDLLKDILIRLSIVKIANKQYEIIWSFHHIIMDGWCTTILIKDMLLIYHSLQRGKIANLPPVAPYKNYINWLEKQNKEKGIDYWKNYLAGYENLAIIPFHLNSRGEERNRYEQKEYRFIINKSYTKEWERLSEENNVTISTIFQTCWGILLQKYNNTNDIVFGAIVSGRPANIEDIETMVGLFINTIPVRMQYETGESFVNFLKKTQRQLIQSRFHEFVPLAEIQSNSLLKRDLINHIVIIENYPLDKEIESLSRSNNEFSVVSVDVFEQSHYDLDVFVILLEELEVKIKYNSIIYNEQEIERIESHLVQIIEQISINPKIAIEQIEFISPLEKNQILFEFNNTKATYPQAKAHELFEMQEAENPERIGVIEGNHLISYGQLNQNINRIARLFKHFNIGENHIVAILLKRSHQSFETIMALWKVGAAYIPLEIDSPPQRIIEILKNSGTRFFVSRSEHVNHVIETNFEGKIIKFDKEEYNLLSASGTNLNIKTDINNLAYVLYTSGSTGKPKGAMVEHIGSMNHMMGKITDTQMSADSIMVQNGPQTFDISIWQFFAPLTLGSKTIIYSHSILLEPDLFITRLIRDQVTILEVVPSYLTVLLYFLEKKAPISLPLKYILPTGEELKAFQVKKWFKLFPDIKMINTYGPTEASDDIAHYIMDKAPESEIVPVGKPLQNLNMYIVDNHMNLCPIGIKGEICVSGIGVGRGYLKDELKTKKVFSEDPFQEEKGIRLYKMGDWGCWLPDGNIVFLGRKDFQVKIRGHLIECGEIESRLREIHHIKETVVIGKEDKNGNKYLCAYLVTDSLLDVADIRAHLSTHLPEYMIPSYFQFIDEIPLNSNGKIDIKALPKPEIKGGNSHVAPRDAIETKLLEIWMGILGIDSTSSLEATCIDNNFFELGGHSLRATILAAMIHKEFDVKIPLTEIFDTPTIRGLSNYIKEVKGICNEKENKYISLEAGEKKEYFSSPLTQKRFYILQQLNPESIGYNLPLIMIFDGNLDRKKLDSVFINLINRHESLKTSFELIDGEVVQRINDQVEFAIEHYSPSCEKEEQTVHNFVRPFVLEKAPLLRVGLIKTGTDKHILMIDTHHIIMDGLSSVILSREFAELYEGNELTPLRLQYKDFSEWQNSETERERLKKQGEFWKKQFEKTAPTLNLRTDFQRPPLQRFEGNVIDFVIEAKETKALNDLALMHGTSLFIVLFSIYNVLLWKLSDQTDIVVGTGVLNRSHADLLHIIGLFFNTIPLRNHIEKGLNFKEYLNQVQKKTLEAFENQEYPLDMLVEDLINLSLFTRDPSRNPLFDTMFALQNFGEGIASNTETELTGLTVSPYPFEKQISRFDLFFESTQHNDTIHMRVEYSTVLFKESTIQKMADNYLEIINQVLEDIEIKLENVSISNNLVQVDSNANHAEYMNFGF